MPFDAEPPFTHGAPAGVGILLVNLGTPDEPTPFAVRRYLKEFLSDSRVVEIAKPIWWLILNGIILNVRPKKTAKKYAGIWMKEGSPLRVYTSRQTQMLRGYLGEVIRSPLKIENAMRYGNPSIAAAAATLADVDDLVVVPLYPQFAASSTQTAVIRTVRQTALQNSCEVSASQ